jgi:hypothetical protein
LTTHELLSQIPPVATEIMSAEDRAKDIFVYAESFSLASESLAQVAKASAKLNEKNRPALSINECAPIVVLDSFATELYLKSLHWLDHGRGPERLHTYNDLFDALLPSTRQEIKTWYMEMLNGQYSAALKQHSTDVPGFDHSLENCLKLASETFPKIRYGYELRGVSVEIFYWPALRIAVRNVIASSHPGWSWVKK